MTRPSRSILLVSVALVLGACGGGAQATSAPTAGPTTAPTATPAAPATDAGGAGAGVGGAVTALADLASYRFSMRIAAEGKGEFLMVTSGGSMSIAGTVIIRPERAMDITVTTGDASGAAASFAYRIIGTKAYMNLGADQWVETPESDAAKTIDSFKPEALMAGFGSLDGMQAVGDEDRGGVATTHYKGAAPAIVAGTFGLPNGTWTMEAWVARDGGRLVSSSLVGEAPDGKFSMTMDITDVDSPANTVETPRT
jgi:hypothetical protein